MKGSIMYSDRFKINWTERNRGYLTTSVTGFEYQLKAWKRDYFGQYNKAMFHTRIITEIENDDGTVTMTVARKLNK